MKRRARLVPPLGHPVRRALLVEFLPGAEPVLLDWPGRRARLELRRVHRVLEQREPRSRRLEELLVAEAADRRQQRQTLRSR